MHPFTRLAARIRRAPHLGMVAALLLAPGLGACDIFKQDGRLDLRLTDAPYTEASSVIVTVTGVELKPHDDDRQRFVFDTPRRIDLVELRNGVTTQLLSDERLPAGDYDSLRLLVRTSPDNTSDAAVTLGAGGSYPLYVDDPDDEALTLADDFSIDDNGTTALTLDVDLRRSLRAPNSDAPGAYRLVPALRLVTDDDAGTVKGTVSPAWRPSGCVPAVYVYRGTVDSADVDDIGGSRDEPLTSATVSLGDGSYTVAFLPEGRYTAAFTCDADADDPEDNDDLNFKVVKSFDINAGSTRTLKL